MINDESKEIKSKERKLIIPYLQKPKWKPEADPRKKKEKERLVTFLGRVRKKEIKKTNNTLPVEAEMEARS